jgi:hypothetical protein
LISYNSEFLYNAKNSRLSFGSIVDKQPIRPE